MTEMRGSAGWPEDFSGVVRLFPLPNLVLFPHVVQPLHIFEPRYCEMLRDALTDDHLIAMALLQKGWEESYLQRPSIASTLCIGKILSHTPTEDGRHNILLVGMKRATLIEEIEDTKPFRTARVEVLDDYYPQESAEARSDLQQRLQDLFSKFVPGGPAAQASFQQLVGQQLPLGVLTDTVTYALNLPVTIKQQLLAERNVDIRCRILLRCMEQQLKNTGGGNCTQSHDEFPPKFSDN
ncbi:MAG: LON peptidase substrate-binding domain-containing protein [bacterium]|nr:LON peptidase substrate-binding domain-containing protein [bacterium]